MIPAHLHSRRRPAVEKSGFALVITLSLMILLTVIAVGLLTLSAISLRASSSSAAISEARQNARMALILAIGELQKQAGPDQRVTATADIAGDANGLAVAAGTPPGNDKTITGASKGLSPVAPGTRWWTGVWANANTSATPDIEAYTETPSPNFLQWLVSGNEGEKTPVMTPASAACSLGANGTVSDAKTAVVLVGAETVGDASTDTLGRYVAVPLVGIQRNAGSVKRQGGRYGWWIGDEGVKARINIPTTKTDPDSYASLSAQRRGWETVAGFAAYPKAGGAGQDLLARTISVPTAALLVAGISSGSGGSTPLQSVFHSATADSRAVIADTLSGGTRIDLTAIMKADLASSSPVPSIINYPVKGGNIIPRSSRFRSMKAPIWDTLKEFYDQSASLKGGALLVSPAATVKDISIAPLITDLRILMGVKFIPVVAGTSVKANACGKIAIAIANPYALTLKWDKDLEIEIVNITPPGNSPSRIWNLGSNSVFINRDTSEPSVFNQTIFRIKPDSLEPGEGRAYTLAGTTVRPIGSGTRRVVVDLAPFGSARPADFTKCVELDASGVYPPPGVIPPPPIPSLDVRESWQTTLTGLEMRLAGASPRAQPLRSIDGFQLDNGYYGSNTRYYTIANLAGRTLPIPLMCYSFQISQPGVDYLNLMPSGYALGQRSSAIRTFADFNLRATRISAPIASYNPPPYFMESNNGFAQLPDYPSGQTGQAFTKNLDSPMPWGRGWTGSGKTVLFSVPSQFTSLAQFQHADLTGDDVAASLGHQPGNAFGNSYATPFVKRSLTVQRRTDYQLIGATNPSGANGIPRNYYDISYLLNTAVWDSYFLSTIGESATSSEPENPSLVRLDPKSPDLTDPVKCASQLMIDGAFNVNSTDKPAWKAFLASTKGFKHKADNSASDNAAFPRSLEQPSPSAQPATGTGEDSFAGYRRLSDTELDLLAGEMVKQVRMRGPFLSLGQFVNRSLADISRTPAFSRSGALQSAIDESGININYAGNKKGLAGVNANIDRASLLEKENAPRADMDGEDRDSRPGDMDADRNPVWAVTSKDNNFGAVASIAADRTLLNRAKNEQGYRSTGIPGWLTQADVLQAIGPSIASRSDTFRIRTYGESLDAAGKVVAKAYCEAIVQRLPEYIDPADAAWERGDELTKLNQTYGRKFTIVSFRWLSPQEI